jgi:hypothetical protein
MTYDPYAPIISFTPDVIREAFADEEDLADRLAELSDGALNEAALEYLGNTWTVWDSYDEWCHNIINMAEQLELDGNPAGPCPVNAQTVPADLLAGRPVA